MGKLISWGVKEETNLDSGYRNTHRWIYILGIDITISKLPVWGKSLPYIGTTLDGDIWYWSLSCAYKWVYVTMRVSKKYDSKKIPWGVQ